MLCGAGLGSYQSLGWQTPIPVVNELLLAVLVGKGFLCDFEDRRLNASTREADRAAEKFERLFGPARD